MWDPGGARRRHTDFDVIDALNVEWALLAGRPELVVASWARLHPALTGCRTPGEVLQSVPADSDAVLHALLTEVLAGGELAARVVLQAMLGKVVRLSRRADAPVDDCLAAMWCRIRTYPLAERPVRIAANLALDALKAVTSEKRWFRQDLQVAAVDSTELLDELQTRAEWRASLDHGAEVAALTAAAVISRADRLGLIDSQSRDVLLTVYADGLTGGEAAERHRTSPQMIRFRCSRAVRKLARHAASLAEAA